MASKEQLALHQEVMERYRWYAQLKEKTFAQLQLAPAGARRPMMDMVNFIEDVAIPAARRLLVPGEEWTRDAAVEFFETNKTVCEMTAAIEVAIRSGGS